MATEVFADVLRTEKVQGDWLSKREIEKIFSKICSGVKKGKI
jgi:hypothetical protein